MGSQIDDISKAPELELLPDASSRTLVLTHPTDKEKRRTWTRNHREWGGPLSLEKYLEREPYLTTIPLARDGGITHWILSTTTSPEPDQKQQQRPVLASCETIRKRVLVARPGSGAQGGDGGAVVEEATGDGIGSVYTYQEFRGRSYAARMLRELGETLRTWPKSGAPANGADGDGKKGEDAVCSALWSDIGKVFYAKKGWVPFPSVHASFPPLPPTSTSTSTSGGRAQVPLEPITYANLASFTSLDESLLRRRLARTAAQTRRPAFAFAPDHDALRWHLFRESCIASLVHGGSADPSAWAAETIAKGVAAGPEGRRVWAVWARNYVTAPPDRGDDSDEAEAARGKNALYILRLVVEGYDEDAPLEGQEGGAKEEEKEELAAAFGAVVDAARAEAAAWGLGKVDLWNPTPLVCGLLARCGTEELPHEWVEREGESIPSLMWYGAGEDVGEVDWVASEKYCWC
ncbi:hypothetical protein DL766_003485 [Monosporascus sp. MC13-8B]|nr:hypothetical protein DL763_000587 [Monosporascus cannonballus]RYP33354.1 hypothetical protein DL766_003485 [Monosporascus sp. MC13-8B]